MQKKKLHYAWVIAASLFCLQGGIYGILMNCRGMFHSPVCSSLGFVLGDFTLYVTFYGISAVLAIPIATKIVPKCNLPLVATFCSLLIAVGQFCQGYFTALWQWYLMAVVHGVCQVFVYTLTVGIVINNWFRKKNGLVMSLIGTASGIIGAILNIVCNSVINQYGWQTGYRFLGVLLFFLMVPASMLLRLSPADKGLLPYGYEGEQGSERKAPLQKGVPVKEANRSPALYMFLISVGTICVMTCYSQFSKDYAISLGFSNETAAVLVSVSLVGNILIKLVIGALTDRIGFRKSQTIALGMVVLSAVLLPINNVVTLYISCFLMGASMAAASVMNPGWTRTIFGDYDYVKIFSKATLINSLLGAVGFTLCGYIISALGYRAFMFFGIFVALVAYICAFFSHEFGKKLKWVTKEEQ